MAKGKNQMPKFKVTKCVDAYAHFTTVVEADNADAAIAIAKIENDILLWNEEDLTYYDNASWDNIEPEELIDAQISGNC